MDTKSEELNSLVNYGSLVSDSLRADTVKLTEILDEITKHLLSLVDQVENVLYFILLYYRLFRN